MTIGEKLRQLRISRNESLDTAANNIGITKSSLAMYERDERTPRDQVKVALANYYGQSIEHLFFAT
ncbi:MAG: helix-turn-helix domain-containing protein [Clostridia bacterium]|nr:helix-turn-helix domain-containing protein [Clostridia bacterium]